MIFNGCLIGVGAFHYHVVLFSKKCLDCHFIKVFAPFCGKNFKLLFLKCNVAIV